MLHFLFEQAPLINTRLQPGDSMAGEGKTVSTVLPAAQETVKTVSLILVASHPAEAGC